MGGTKVTADGNKLILERTFDAPKDKVWEAWTNPENFTKWWGPNGWSTTVKQFDFKPGGSVIYGMKCEDKNQGEFYGQESWGKMDFETIDPKDTFTYVDSFTDTDGKVSVEMPQAQTSLSFEEADGRTKMTSITTYKTEADLKQVLEMGMEQGIKETLDRLEAFLK